MLRFWFWEGLITSWFSIIELSGFELDSPTVFHPRPFAELWNHLICAAGNAWVLSDFQIVFLVILCFVQVILDEDDESSVLKEEASAGKDIDPKVAAATLEVLGEDAPQNGVTEPEGLDSFSPRPNRTTLSGALRGHEVWEAAHDDLFRLLCHLRMGPNGCDSDVIRNPLLTRKLVLGRPKRWHDLVRHQISHANAMDNLPSMRKSRVSAWIQATEAARQNAAPGLPSSLKICSGDVVAVRFQGCWRVSMVLTTWRVLKKGTGAQQCVGQIPKGGLHSARLLILVEEEGKPGVFLRRSAQSMHGVSSGLHWCTVRQRQHEQKAGLGRRQSFAAGGPGILKWLCLAGSNQDVQQDTIHHRGMCLFKPRQSILDPGYINVGVGCFGCRRISTAHYAA